MDLVSAVLDGHRAHGAFVLRCAMSPPWGVRVADRAAVALVVVHRDTVCLVPADGEPVRLGPGDAAIVKSGAPYLLADDLTTAPDVVIEPGQVCRSLGRTTWEPPSGRVWGNDPDGSCGFVVGVYELDGQVSGRVLRDLPDLMIVRAADPSAPAGPARAGGTNRPAVDLLVAEVDREGPGQDLVLDRLVDLLLVDTLRAWLTVAGAAAPAWWRAQHDAVTGSALRHMHEQPEQPWTLASLAAAAGVSRATLARRFAADVGTPPLAYLTEWRLARAADLLRTSDATVERVGHQVGYANAFAFSTAFKRHYGHSPRAHRRAG